MRITVHDVTKHIVKSVGTKQNHSNREQRAKNPLSIYLNVLHMLFFFKPMSTIVIAYIAMKVSVPESFIVWILTGLYAALEAISSQGQRDMLCNVKF